MNSLLNQLKTKMYRPLLNVGSGLALAMFSPFKKGDFIEIDGKIGSVENRGINKTSLKSPEGNITTIENSKFYSKSLNNLSTKNIIRLELKLTVDLNEDMKALKADIFHFLSEKKTVLSSPAPKIQVAKIQKKHIELLVNPWCLLDDFLELDTKLEKLLKDHLAKRIIDIEANDSFISERKLMAS